MEPSLVVVRDHPRRQKPSRIAPFFLRLRYLQFTCAITVPFLCLWNRFTYMEAGMNFSNASNFMTKIVAWCGTATVLLTGLGILRASRERHYWFLLLLDRAACLSSLISAGCLTGIATTYWRFNRGPWIASIVFVWVCWGLTFITMLRTMYMRRRPRFEYAEPPRSAPQPARFTQEPIREIDVWRHNVDPEFDPLIMHHAASRASSDLRTNEDIESGSTRSPSPVSTVAHWTTVSGTNTLITQYTEPPPLYSRSER